MENAEKLKANRKRNKTIIKLKKDNMDLADSLEKYIKENCMTLADSELDMSYKLIKNLRYCSNATLYGQTNDNIKIISSLTVDKNYWRKEFSEETKKAIKKGNEDYFTDDYIKKLKPNGSTFVDFESVYRLVINQKTGKKERKYETDINSEATKIAVMETISYHFKPKLFCTTEKDFWGRNSYDLEAIVEIITKLHRGNKMYHKFGCLEKEKCLNIKDDSLLEDYDETAEDVDEETGEVLQTHYFITNPLNTYPKGVENEIHIKRRAVIKNLNVQSGREAVQELVNYSIKGGRYV